MAKKKKDKTISDQSVPFSPAQLPHITPEMISELLNEHLNENGRYHGHFHCGRRLGYGGSGIVYKLYYVPGEDDDNNSPALPDLAVKVINPVQTFIKSHPEWIHSEKSLDEIVSSPEFAPLKRSSLRLMTSIARSVENRYFEHHFLRYYPEFSFPADSVVPYTAVVVMDEVAGTLKDLKLPEDLPAVIRMTVKLGREIGEALQVTEYADEGSGFLHRDLKPGNIGITVSMNSEDVYEFVLIDIDSGIPDSFADRTQTLIVNEFSKAPEFSDGTDRDEIDYARVDMYNLGCLMKYITAEHYELLPASLKRIIRKASHKDPSHRYDSGEELIRDLEQFEENYAGGSSSESLNIRRFMDEQKEQLAEEKRKYQVRRTELNQKLTDKTKEIARLNRLVKDLRAEVDEWKDNYDTEVIQEETLQAQFDEYKKKAEAGLDTLAEIKKKLRDTENAQAELSFIREVNEISLKDLRKKNDQLTADLKKLKDTQKEKTADLKKKADSFDSLKAELEVTRTVSEINIRDLKTALTKEKDEHQREIRALRNPNVREIRIALDGKHTNLILKSYDEEGRLVSELWPETRDTLSNKYEYSDDGSMLKSEYRDGRITETDLYDADGLLQKTTFYTDGIPDEVNDYEYSYNRRGQISKVTINSRLSEVHSYLYDKNGRIIEHRIEKLDGPDTQVHIKKYDTAGLLKSEISYINNKFGYCEIIYTRNEQGKEIHSDWLDENSVVITERNMYYDSLGRLILEITNDIRYRHTTVTEYAY